MSTPAFPFFQFRGGPQQPGKQYSVSRINSGGCVAMIAFNEAVYQEIVTANPEDMGKMMLQLGKDVVTIIHNLAHEEVRRIVVELPSPPEEDVE